jgi:hypothetical protein
MAQYNNGRRPHKSTPERYTNSDLDRLDAHAADLRTSGPGPWRELIHRAGEVYLCDADGDALLRFAKDAPDELVDLLGNLSPNLLRQLIHEALLWREYVQGRVRPADAGNNAHVV